MDFMGTKYFTLIGNMKQFLKARYRIVLLDIIYVIALWRLLETLGLILLLCI